MEREADYKTGSWTRNFLDFKLLKDRHGQPLIQLQRGLGDGFDGSPEAYEEIAYAFLKIADMARDWHKKRLENKTPEKITLTTKVNF